MSGIETEIDVRKLEDDAQDLIRSGTWNHCWYWEIAKTKGFTEKGWREALADAEDVIAGEKRHLKRLEDVRDRIESFLDTNPHLGRAETDRK